MSLREAAESVLALLADESVEIKAPTVAKWTAIIHAVSALRAELAKPDAPAAAPDGWQLVPVEPTPAMIEAARDVKRRRLLRAVEDTKAGREPNTMGATMACDEEWQAMLAAAPRPAPAEPQESMREAPADILTRLRDTPNWMRESYGSWKDGVLKYDRAPFEAAEEIERLRAALSTQPAAQQEPGKGER